MINWWTQVEPQELVVKARKLDAMFWSSILARKEPLRKAMPDRAAKIIGGDMFQACYQFTPQVKDKQVSPDAARGAWIEQYMREDGYRELHSKTAGDKHLSAIAALKVYQEFIRHKSQIDRSKYQAFKSLMTEEEKLTATAEDGVNPLDDVMKQIREKLAEEIEEDQLNRQLVPTPEVAAMQSAIETASGDVEMYQMLAEVDSYLHSGIGSGDGAARGEDTSARALELSLDEQLANQLGRQDEMRKIAKLAGRVTAMLEGAKASKPTPAPPPVSITLGDDLGRLLPQELAFLDEDMEDLFWMKWLEKGLMQYEVEQKPKAGKGPMVIAIDVSGSMESGQRKVIAHAVFIALAKMALSESRAVWKIYFASAATEAEKLTSIQQVISMRGTRRNMAAIGGGTEFYPPLAKALDLVEKTEPNADIVIISDGMSGLVSGEIQRVNDRKKELGCRCWGIAVQENVDWDEAYGLGQVCNAIAVVKASDKGSMEWMRELVQGIA